MTKREENLIKIGYISKELGMTLSGAIKEYEKAISRICDHEVIAAGDDEGNLAYYCAKCDQKI